LKLGFVAAGRAKRAAFDQSVAQTGGTPMRKLHLVVGLVGIAVFLSTGLYMFRGFPELYGTNEAVRYMYRANHVYVLLSSLINVALAIYLVPARPGWKAWVGKIGSVLLILSPPILCYAFFAEAPKATPERAFTGLGVLALLLGVLAHLPNYRAQANA
jgi:hypothetical protein